MVSFTMQVTSATPLRVSLELEGAVAVPGPNEAMRGSPADLDHWSVLKLPGHPEMGFGDLFASRVRVTTRRLDGQVFGQVSFRYLRIGVLPPISSLVVNQALFGSSSWPKAPVCRM